MTQRTEVRFKLVQRNATTVYSGMRYQYYDFAFNHGGGTLSLSQYTIPESGVYLMGQTYNKVSGTNHPARSQCNLTRNGTTTIIQKCELHSGVANTTCSNYFMYKFEEGDVLNFTSPLRQSRMNINSYSGDDTLNSWWGIKLNY